MTYDRGKPDLVDCNNVILVYYAVYSGGPSSSSFLSNVFIMTATHGGGWGAVASNMGNLGTHVRL